MLTLSSLRGQRKAVSLLEAALLSQKIPHAYLFVGNGGVGKKTAAIALAAALNCNNPTPDACGTCLSCRKTEASKHPDVHRLEPEGKTIKIQEVRDIQRYLKYLPLEGRRHVVLIGKGELLGPHSSNALLKLFEEPPTPCLFLILAASTAEILPTLVSRCQIIPFRQLSPNTILEILLSQGVNEEVARLASRIGLGSITRARQYLDKTALEARKNLYDALIKLEKESHWNAADCLEFAETLSSFPLGESEVFILIELFRRDIFLILQRQENAICNRDYLEELRTMAKNHSPLSIAESLIELARIRMLLAERNLNLRLVMEYLLFVLKPKRGI